MGSDQTHNSTASYTDYNIDMVALRRQRDKHECHHSADRSDAHRNKKRGQLRMSRGEAAALIGSESDFRMSNAHARMIPRCLDTPNCTGSGRWRFDLSQMFGAFAGGAGRGP